MMIHHAAHCLKLRQLPGTVKSKLKDLNSTSVTSVSQALQHFRRPYSTVDQTGAGLPAAPLLSAFHSQTVSDSPLARFTRPRPNTQTALKSRGWLAELTCSVIELNRSTVNIKYLMPSSTARSCGTYFYLHCEHWHSRNDQGQHVFAFLSSSAHHPVKTEVQVVAGHLETWQGPVRTTHEGFHKNHHRWP